MNNIIICQLFKNIIIEQNKSFLKMISEKHDISYDLLLEKYLRPEFYLPVIIKTAS